MYGAPLIKCNIQILITILFKPQFTSSKIHFTSSTIAQELLETEIVGGVFYLYNRNYSNISRTIHDVEVNLKRNL